MPAKQNKCCCGGQPPIECCCDNLSLKGWFVNLDGIGDGDCSALNTTHYIPKTDSVVLMFEGGSTPGAADPITACGGDLIVPLPSGFTTYRIAVGIVCTPTEHKLVFNLIVRNVGSDTPLAITEYPLTTDDTCCDEQSGGFTLGPADNFGFECGNHTSMAVGIVPDCLPPGECECLIEEDGDVQDQIGATISFTVNETPETYTDPFGFGCTATACPNVDGTLDVGCNCIEKVIDCVLLCTYSSFGQTRYVWGALSVSGETNVLTVGGVPCTLQVDVVVRSSVVIINDDPTPPACVDDFIVLRDHKYTYRLAAGQIAGACECIIPSISVPLALVAIRLDDPGACDFSPDITVTTKTLAPCSPILASGGAKRKSIESPTDLPNATCGCGWIGFSSSSEGKCPKCGKIVSLMLGSQVAELMDKLGVKKVAEAYTKITGRDCGCKGRERALNKFGQWVKSVAQ